jgi:hypothetical protein
VPDSLEILKRLAADPHPRVRLEAVRAASFYKVPEALEVVLVSLDSPADIYLDYTRGETTRQLEQFVKKAIAAGQVIPFTTNAGARYFLKNISTEDLLKVKRTPAVYSELLFRKGVRDEFRKEAVAGLAKSENKTELAVLLDALRLQDDHSGDPQDGVAFDLMRLLTDRGPKQLVGVRPELEMLATKSQQPVTRQLGYVALIAADDNVDKAWTLATQSAGSLIDLVSAMPLVRDPGLKASLYPKVEPLLRGVPADRRRLPFLPSWAGLNPNRYPRESQTLTLAEVEVCGGRSGAPGQATQDD